MASAHASFCNLFFFFFSSSSNILFFFFFFILLFPLNTAINASDESNIVRSFIVYTDITARPSHFLSQDDWYDSMIGSLTTDHGNGNINSSTSSSEGRIFYKYDVVFNGFAARFTDGEAESFAKIPGVIGLFEDKATVKPQTTHSPGFLGLNVDYGLWPDTNFAENVIIGLVDTGIWPESESFEDSGLGPIPSRWKGTCEEGAHFNASNCNKKLIGARFFVKGMEHYYSISAAGIRSPHEDEDDVVYYQSPRDDIGHGTLTAATAAGAEVANANMLGFANGHARGIATKARIAMYKACIFGKCSDADIFAAIESAIEDGVDILSISLGGSISTHFSYDEDGIAKGALAAVQKNIFVSCSAGNDGPLEGLVENTAPWITTVGAGSIDRTFPVLIQLGNNMSFIGSSLYSGKMISRKIFFRLVYIRNCSCCSSVVKNIKGKIVVCGGGNALYGLGIQAAGGVGLIELNDISMGEGLVADPYILPAARVGYREGLKIVSYIKSARYPKASFKTHNLTVVGKERAPIVAHFSSRGPDKHVPEILKPDIIAPGLNILAASQADIPPTGLPNDPRRVKFNIESGTSLACNCPIVRYENIMQPATALDMGAGHVNPQLAADPGLVYDAGISDYIRFLCSLNRTTKETMKLLPGGPYNCSHVPPGSPGDLNYPSFSVVFNKNFKATSKIQKYKRTVTNVGDLPPETYRVRIVNPGARKVSVTVKPQVLVFNTSSEKQSYTVTFQSKTTAVNHRVFGSISWYSIKHAVRSPFVVMWKV